MYRVTLSSTELIYSGYKLLTYYTYAIMMSLTTSPKITTVTHLQHYQPLQSPHLHHHQAPFTQLPTTTYLMPNHYLHHQPLLTSRQTTTYRATNHYLPHAKPLLTEPPTTT